MKRAFTLIELMVVIGIIVILAAVAIPAVKAIGKGNAETQATNQVRSMIAYARSLAISEHREAGIVFFEQTAANAGASANMRQTAMQVFIEDYNQAQYTPADGTTVYVRNSGDIHYLPAGIMLASLSTDELGGTGNTAFNTHQSTIAYQTRAILFNGSGQLITRGQIATPNPTGPNQFYADWDFVAPNYTPPVGQNGPTSSGAFVIFNQNEYNNASFPSETARVNWLQQHADIIVINPYTGGFIR